MQLRTSVESIVATVDRITSRFRTRNPQELCTALGIDIVEMDLRRKLKAFYFYQSRISTIVMDENVIELFRPILLAHELGHYCLHREIAMMRGFQELEVLEKRDTDPLELEATLFAAELLIRDEQVTDLLNEYTFFETASILNVPAALLDFKFAILQKCKGYKLSALGIAESDFLKEDLGAYDSRNDLADSSC